MLSMALQGPASVDDVYYGLCDAISRLQSAAADLRACRRPEADAVDELIRALECDCDDLGARLDAAERADRAWEDRQYRESVSGGI